jgi:hypothetical protein
MNLEIENVGSATLNLSGVSLSGPNAAAFTITSDTGEASLAPGGTRSITILFDPSTTGAKMAMIDIESDDTDEPTVSVTLTGLGVESGPTGLTNTEILSALLGLTQPLPFDDYDVNDDGVFNVADLVANVNAINAMGG